MSADGVYYPAYTPGMGSRPRLQSVHPFRNLMMSGTHMNGAWAGGESGHSGYGADSADYDYHSGPPAHVPSGGSFYHATADTGYGVPAAPNTPVKGPSVGGGKKGAGGGKKGSGSTTVTALTLLSFFFFVNLLQGCIKEHMDSMNPTVMVMTTNVIRNRNFNKMGEMNSREQNAGVSSSSSFNGIGGNLVMQPADMVASAAANSAAVMEATKPGINLESPYSGVAGSVNKPLDYQQQQIPAVQPPAAPVYHTNKPEPEVHYPRPYYDPHQPDANEPQQYYPQQTQYTNQPQQTPIYTNHTYYQQPPSYIASHEQPLHNNYPPQSSYPYPQSPPSLAPPQSSYHYQPTPAPSALLTPQYSTPRNPFYEHQYPSSSPHIYKGHQEKPQSFNDNDSRYSSHRYEMTSLPHKPQNPVPWSSHSSSVMTGSFRRASIVAVSPSPKWVSVPPANVDDHTDFGMEEERAESSEDTGRNNRYSESYYGKFQ